jgi:hypothetical protein
MLAESILGSILSPELCSKFSFLQIDCFEDYNINDSLVREIKKKFSFFNLKMHE